MTLDRLRYRFLSADPGLQRLKHGAKTVLAVVIALEALRFFESPVALYAGMSAGFLMQSTAGTGRRTRQITMASMGVASVVAVGVGSLLAAQHWAKELLLVAAAFLVFYVRRFIPGKAMFPVFAFILALLATVQPGGAGGGTGSALAMMTAVAGGFAAAFAVYFYIMPDESMRAFRHAAELFRVHLRHGSDDPAVARSDLRAMHRAVALEEEEREQLGALAPEICERILEKQYDGLQVLILLNDMELHPDDSGSRRAAKRVLEEYLAQNKKELKQYRAALQE